MSRQSAWVPCNDQPLLVELCEHWNKGKLYEILWEYSQLSPSILNERKAKGWLYFENARVQGFALGRELRGLWQLEELWGPCEGSSGIDLPAHPADVSRARAFNELLKSISSPILIRAPVDNSFANLLAKRVGAEWCGGFLLAKKSLRRKGAVSLPKQCVLRKFKKGDEYHLSRIHRSAFDYPNSPGAYRKWATANNCRTTVAVFNNKPVGFFIAEKRPYNKLGDFNVAVDPLHNGLGIGAALLENGLNDLYEIGVRVVIADFLLLNARAQALYGKHGFQIARAYNYYKLRRKTMQRRR